jgi:hypothetical protein
MDLRRGVTLGALVVAGLHLLRPELENRLHHRCFIDYSRTTVLPWAQPLIKSIELLGVKLELQDLKNEVANAKGAAASAERKAEYLLSSVPSTRPIASAVSTREAADQSFTQLMREYEHVRSTQSAGAARTQAMTAIVRKMIELAPSLQNCDVAKALMSNEDGERLAAYAYLYARPDIQLIGPLVTSVTRLEDKPFGQYWGLQAISRVLTSREGVSVPDAARLQLRQFAQMVPRGTDRDYEIRKILRDLGETEGSD